MTANAAPPDVAAQIGDVVIPNHDFSDGMTDWSSAWMKSGDSVAPAPQCSAAAAVEGAGAEQSLRVTSVAECANPAVLSATVPVIPGSRYTAWINASETELGTEVGLRFTDASGSVVGMTWTGMQADSAPELLRVEAVAPASAVSVGVVLSAITTALYDDVLLSAQLTDLGTQLSVPSSANGSAYSTDGQGHDMAYSVMVGAHGVDARLAGIRLDTFELQVNIPIPGAMGSWNAYATADGTIYIGSYNYADVSIGGRLFSYTPGADEVVDLGSPVPGEQFLYGTTGGPDGSIIGGTYPGGVLWQYSPGEGFSTIGPQPILPDVQYVRSVGYDPVTDLVFAGTAGTSHIVACHADGSGECTEILPESYVGYAFVYNLTAGEGRVFARVTDDHGDDHLVIIEPSVAADGTISAVVKNDIPAVSYPGSSLPFEGAVYYAKAGKLFRYDIATDTETDLNKNTGIFARHWAVRRMVDQTTFPGDTLVGVNSRGEIATYGIQDGTLRTGAVDKLPLGVADIEKIVGGPDGQIYTSGYLIGNLSSYGPMTGEAPLQFSSNLGYGQSEGMTVLGDRVYLGIYPGGEIRSFDPATVTTPSRLDCVIGDQQDRPYAMLGAPNGRVYAGTMAIYGQLSGALTEYDPATGDCTPYRNIVPNQSIVSAAWSKDRVVAGSLVWGGLGVPATEPEAKLAVFDPATKESHTVDLPVRGLRSVTAMTTDNDGMIWLLAQNHLMAFDPETEEFTKVSKIYPELTYGGGNVSGRISAYDSQLQTSLDGRIFGTIRGKFFELDPRLGTVETVAAGKYSHVAFDAYGSVYSVVGANKLFRYVPESIPVDQPPVFTPEVTASPSQVAPGDVVTLALSGFAPSATGGDVEVYMGGKLYGSTKIYPDGNGTAKVRVAGNVKDGKLEMEVRQPGADIPGVKASVMVKGKVTPTPSTPPPSTPVPTFRPQDVYTTPGYHTVSGRQWFTKCEPYSATSRCWTSIWATQVTNQGGKFVSKTGWFHNNLTYLPSPRSMWANNPLGHAGNWTAADGRKWYTECDTAQTGGNGCRSYIHMKGVVESTPKKGGGYTYSLVNKWVFNNIVLFK